MPGKATPKPAVDDERLMSLVEMALAQPSQDRDTYIRTACENDPELITQVRRYVAWEERMDGFLLDPLFPPPDIEHRFDPGELLAGRFRIVRGLDEGGMGVVYEAVDEKLERRLAIKCAKAGFRQRLSPEVRNASEISHPNVCKIYELHTATTDHGEVDFIAMELLEGETLFTRLRGGRIPESQARSIARQLCAGLAEAHRHRVVHGDLKSNNVILASDADGTERAVITDFGLARGPAASAARGAAQSLEPAGTPDYMAPELWKGEKPSTASDVYALGVLLCELAVGRRPFGSQVPLEERITSSPPPIHPKWDRVLSSCLAPDPQRRFRDAAEVAKALDPPRRQRWWLTAAAAVVLALSAAGLTYERVTAPKESWRLAMMPVQALSPDLSGVASDLSAQAANTLLRINGGRFARIAVLPPGKAQATPDVTHTVRATVARENGKLRLHASVFDNRSGVNSGERTLVYSPGDERYAPVALAGVVTASLKLPPLAVPAVGSRAAKDYWDGIWYTRQNSTLDEAIQALQQAVQQDPASPLTHSALAEAFWLKYYATNQPMLLEDANKELQEAENRDPDVPAAHRVHGYLYYSDGLYGKAIEEFDRSNALQPSAMAYIWLGKTYEDSNLPGEALSALEKARDVEPNYFRVYQNLAGYYRNRSDFSKVAQYQEVAVKLAPNEPNQHSNLALAYVELGRFQDAEAHLRRSIELRETPEADLNLGLTLMYEGQDAPAAQVLQRVLSLDSEPSGGKTLVLMHLSVAYRRLKQFDKAAEANRRGLKLANERFARNPRNGYLNSFLGYFNAALGDRTNAESEIGRALTLFPDDLDTRWRAIRTYEELYRMFKDPGLRNRSLELLMRASAQTLADVSRWPDFADLHSDPRFQTLLRLAHNQ